MMKKINTKIGIGLLSAILLLAVAAPSIGTAIAQQGGGGPPEDVGNQKTVIDCDFDNPIGPGVYEGDIRVKDGKTCTISSHGGDITINGDVIAGTESMLQLYAFDQAGIDNALQINGSVKTNGGLMIKILGAEGNLIDINGDVQITNTIDGISVKYADISGSAQFNSNQKYYSITDSNVDGSVQVKDNTSDEASSMFYDFSDNSIGKNLQCSGNDPAPAQRSGPNTVGGKAQGQCEGLV